MPCEYSTGAEWPNPRYSYTGGQESAADARHRWKTEAMLDFYAQGVLYDPGWNDSTTAWDAMSGWPLTGRRPVCRSDYGYNFIIVRNHLREALSEDTNLLLYGWAQMENPSPLLRALTRNPGIF